MKKNRRFIITFYLVVSISFTQAQTIYTAAGNGVRGYSGDGGSALSAEFYSPNSVTFEGGNYYVADEQNNVIRKINIGSGIITTVAGNGVGGFSGDGGQATAAQMSWTKDVAFDAAENMYISDHNNNRIREVNVGTGIITTVAGTGTGGYNGDGIQATAAQINGPEYIAIDASNNLYIADQNNQRIRKINLSTGIITTVVGIGTAGFSGDGGPAVAAQIRTPYGVCLDNAGNLYVGDQGNSCLREVSVSSGIINTVAGMGGVAGYSGDGGPAISAELNALTGFCVDAAGNIYIADTPNQRVREVTVSSGIINTVAGDGRGGFSGDGGPATAADLYFPNGVAQDSCDDLFIPDWGNQRIREVVFTSGPFTITGRTPICSGTADTLTVSGASSCRWSNGATTFSIIVSPVSSTTYSVQVGLGGGCIRIIDTSITINVNSGPILTVNPSDTICSGQSVSLNVSGATTYIWTPSNGLSCSNCSNPVATPTSNATYVVTGSDGNGCSSTASVNINVSTAPALLPIADQTICSGDQVTIVAGLSSGSGGAYTWEPGGSTSLTIAVTPTVTTTYTLQYENSCGTVSSTTTVYVNPAPTPLFTADITQGCAPMCIQFRDRSTISSGNIIQWYWSFGNGDTSHVKNPIYCYTEPGTYTITHTAISDDGCSASLKNIQMITIFSNPVANFIYSPQPVTILEPTVQFTDESTDAYGIIHWGWNFGDGESTNPDSSYRYPVHSYGDTGEYCPQLIVVNNKGCIDTITECLDVEPIFTFYIPNAFTPNKDGRNDVFLPKGEYVKNFEMYIFNRWGEELFHSTDINEGWNGTFESKKICQEGTYAYKIWVTDLKNKQHSYVGEFLLIK